MTKTEFNVGDRVVILGQDGPWHEYAGIRGVIIANDPYDVSLGDEDILILPDPDQDQVALTGVSAAGFYWYSGDVQGESND